MRGPVQISALSLALLVGCAGSLPSKADKAVASADSRVPPTDIGGTILDGQSRTDLVAPHDGATADINSPPGTWVSVPGQGLTIDRPAAAAFGNGNLIAVLRGNSGDKLWMNRRLSGVWENWTEVPGGIITQHGPSLTTDKSGTVHLFVRGTDGSVQWNRRTQNSWQGWQTVPGAQTTDAPAAVATDDAVHLLLRGSGNLLTACQYTKNAWTTCAEIDPTYPHPMIAAPAALVAPGNKVCAYIIVGSGSISETCLSSGKWSFPSSIGAGLVAASAPAGIVDAQGSRHLFARGTADDVIHIAHDGANWGSLQMLPGQGKTQSAPAAILDQSKIRLFVRGTTNELFTYSY